MVRLRARFVLALLLAGSARADWTVTNSQTDRAPVAGVDHRRIVLTESETGERVTLDLALFSTKSATLRVIDNPSHSGRDNSPREAGSLRRRRVRYQD